MAQSATSVQKLKIKKFLKFSTNWYKWKNSRT